MLVLSLLRCDYLPKLFVRVPGAACHDAVGTWNAYQQRSSSRRFILWRLNFTILSTGLVQWFLGHLFGSNAFCPLKFFISFDEVLSYKLARDNCPVSVTLSLYFSEVLIVFEEIGI